MRVKGFIRVVYLVFLVLAVLPLSARAQAVAQEDKWTFAVQPYLWMPSIDGTLKYTNAQPGANADVNMSSDLLSDLQFGFLVNGEARRGKWAIFTDFIYLSLGSGNSELKKGEFTGPGGRVPFTASANVGTSTTFKASIWELAGSYTVGRLENITLEVLAGFRYLGAEGSTDWNLSAAIVGPGPGQTFARSGSTSQREDIWDGIVGVRGRIGLGDGKWGIPYYLDVGAGNYSTFTFQAMTGIQDKFDWIDANLVWRYLYYSSSGDYLVQNMGFNGPAIGVNFRF
jgi:hypothetical protein